MSMVNQDLVEMRWVRQDEWGADLHIRQRRALADTTGYVYGYSDFGPWTLVDVVDGDGMPIRNGAAK